jgi:hypothetical protein
MMHNWLEGLLQNHAHVKWRIGGSTSNSTQKQKNRTASSVIDDETELTHEVAYEENEAETNNGLTDSGILSMMDLENMDHMNVNSHGAQEPYAMSTKYSTNISLTLQCSYCRSTSLETFNKDLGKKRHGKLKADTWRILFTVFLPLILLEL